MEILKNSFLRKLDKPLQKKIFSLARQKKYAKGDIIFKKDELGNKLFLVRSGRVKIFSSFGYNKRKTFSFLEPGDIFGEMALLGRNTRTASAQAIVPSEILIISKKNFKEFLLRNPGFSLRLMQVLVERWDRADKEIENMIFYNIMGRLASKLLELVGKRTRVPVELDIEQSELAECLGTTRVPICRAISVLKKREILSYKKKKILIYNIDKLKSMASKK